MSEIIEYMESMGLNPKSLKDSNEIHKYAGKISAATWWKTDGVQYLYDFPDQHRRIDWIISMLHGSVLDVGCGEGMITNFTVAQPYVDKQRIIGVDPSPDLVGFANHWRLPSHFLVSVGEALPFIDNGFDCVIAAELLEHVVDPDRLIEECRRVLKKMGTIVLTTPLEEEKWLINAPLPNPLHLRSYTVEQMRELLSKHGFKAFAVPSGQLGEPYKYTYHTPEGWKEKLVQTRLTFIYAAGVKL
jgi:ubiquinone/menaquinone biosynthesis C-methylase UbiE